MVYVARPDMTSPERTSAPNINGCDGGTRQLRLLAIVLNRESPVSDDAVAGAVRFGGVAFDIAGRHSFTLHECIGECNQL